MNKKLVTAVITLMILATAFMPINTDVTYAAINPGTGYERPAWNIVGSSKIVISIIHHEAVYETVHHDAVYETIVHDAVFETVHHEEETTVIHHDAGWARVYVEAHWETVHHDAVYEEIIHPAITETHYICNGCGYDFGMQIPTHEEAIEHWEADGGGYHSLQVIIQDYWVEYVLVEEEYDEEVYHEAGWEYYYCPEPWDEIQTTPAWDEVVLISEAWTETVLVSEAWDEEVLVTEAWDESVVEGTPVKKYGKYIPIPYIPKKIK